MTKPKKPKPDRKKSTDLASSQAKLRVKRLKDEQDKAEESARAKAATAQAKVDEFFDARKKNSTSSKNTTMGTPRNSQTKRQDASTPTSTSDISVASQGNKKSSRTTGPPILRNISKDSVFDDVISDRIPIQLTHPDCPYTDDDCFENGEHHRLITEDALFVMTTAGIDLPKDLRSKESILHIISEKIEELNSSQAVKILDNPVAERFLNIIANFKLSQFRTIFQVVPSRSDKKYINVKSLFKTTVALRRQDLHLPKKFWFLDSFQFGSASEQDYVLQAKREQEEHDADHADNNLKPLSTTGQLAANDNRKPPSTTGQ